MARNIAERQNLTWISIDNVNNDDIEFLKKFKFHPLDIQDLNPGNRHRPKIDIYRSYVFLVFHFPYYNEKDKRINFVETGVFLKDDLIITVIDKGYAPIKEVFEKFKQPTKPRKSKKSNKLTSGFQLYKILDHVFRQTAPILTKFGNTVYQVEESVYNEQPKKTAYEIAVIRRNVLNLRRILDPQRPLISRVMNTNKSFLPEILNVYFDDTQDFLDRACIQLDNFRDSIEGVTITNDFLLSQRINNVMKTLTIISVALLPLTLLTGIYGMNIEGLPFTENPLGVTIMAVLLLGVVIGSIFILRKKRWL